MGSIPKGITQLGESQYVWPGCISVAREGKVFIVKGVKRKDLESAECAMEGLSDRTSGTA